MTHENTRQEKSPHGEVSANGPTPLSEDSTEKVSRETAALVALVLEENRDPATSLPHPDVFDGSGPGSASALSNRMAQNVSIYMASQLVTWIISFIAVSLIPRILGEQHLGELDTAGVAIGPLTFLFTLGIEGYLIREIGHDPSQTNRLLQNTLGMRLVLFPIFVLASCVSLTLFRASPLIWAMGGLIIFNCFIGWLADPLRAVLYAQDQAKRIAAGDFLTTLPGLAMLPFLRYGPLVPLLVGIAFSIMIAALRLLWLRGRVSLRPAFDRQVWKELVRGGIPYLALSYIAVLYSLIGVVLLRHFIGTAAVGEHGQAQKLQGTFLFVPTALSSAILPSLLRLARTEPERFRRMQGQVLSFVLVTVLPASVGIFLLAAPLCHLLYGPGRFVHIPLAVKIMAFNIVPLYIVSTLYQFLVAQGRAAAWARYHMATVAIYGVIGLLLVPYMQQRYSNGMAGAVLAGGLAETFGALFALALLKPQVALGDFFARLLRSGVAALLMGAVVLATRHLFLPIPALLGAASFMLLVIPLRLFTPELQEQITSALRRKLRRAPAS